MGSSESSEPQDIVGEVEQPEPEPAISVQYGPNIVGLLLGYDERTDALAQTAAQIYDRTSRPSNQNQKKAQLLVGELMEGVKREPINLDEIEREMMDEVPYKAYLHKRTYGVRSMDDAQSKFSLATMDTVCGEFKARIEACLDGQGEAEEKDTMPYYNDTFSALNCTKEMDLYNDCVSGKLSGLY